MECFDRTPPTVRASISGNVLRVEASDDLSGVTQITVGGKCYTNLTGGTLDVPLKDLGTAEQISIQAADSAGNRSQAVQVKNPNYQAPASSQEPSTVQKPAATTPVTTTPGKAPTTTTAPSTSTPTATTTPPAASTSAVPDPDDGQTEQSAKPLTPDGQGTVVDNVTDEDSKEFFHLHHAQ